MNTFKKIWIQLDPDERNKIKAETLAQIKDVKGGNQEERIRRTVKKLVFLRK